MVNYRRNYVQGACYFFTLVTANRQPVFSDNAAVQHLRTAFRLELRRRPYEMQAVVVLPDHLHALWKLPDNDADYSSRWREIKKHMSKAIGRPAWQKSYWEHTIRDTEDWHRHLDYIHYNPVRHGYVSQAKLWPNSSFSRWVDRGYYNKDWGCDEPSNIVGLELE